MDAHGFGIQADASHGCLVSCELKHMCALFALFTSLVLLSVCEMQ